jgi:hypothetical protein
MTKLIDLTLQLHVETNDDNVISFDRARRESQLLGEEERSEIRVVLKQFDDYRSQCHRSQRHAQEASANTAPPTTAPLSRAEIAQVRQMIAEFAAIKQGCPTARRLLEPEA